MTLLLLYAFIAVGVSFLCSLLEASLLSLTPTQVESLVAQGSRAGQRMQALKANIDRPLAAILTLNTVAHTVGAAGVGAQAAVTFGDAALGAASAVMTLAILVLSEIIPKTLGAVNARRLAGFTSHAVRATMFLCTPLLVPLEWINRLIGSSRERERMSRLEILATIHLGREGGALADREHRIVLNLMNLSAVRLSEILTPRTVIFSLPADQSIEEAMGRQPPILFARIPIYGDGVEDILGYVTRYDVLKAASEGRGVAPLRSLERPILFLPELASVADALERMLDGNEHIAVVVDEHGGVEGIVTLEDVLEALLGQDIVDETDPVANMQRLARRLAARRAAKLDGVRCSAEERKQKPS